MIWAFGISYIAVATFLFFLAVPGTIEAAGSERPDIPRWRAELWCCLFIALWPVALAVGIYEIRKGYKARRRM